MTDPATIALADAWASIDGKMEQFRKGGDRRDSYVADATALRKRLRARGYKIVPTGKGWLRRLFRC